MIKLSIETRDQIEKEIISMLRTEPIEELIESVIKLDDNTLLKVYNKLNGRISADERAENNDD